METSRRGREQIVYSKKKKKNSVYKRQMDSDLQQKLILKGIMVEDFNLEEIRADQKKKKRNTNNIQFKGTVSDSAGN